MSSVYEEMMKQYSNSHNGNKGSKSKEYDLKNYFTTYLPDGVKEATKRIRILPPLIEGTSPIITMWGHKRKIDGAWKTFPCLKHEKNSPCPFCEARELLLSQGDEQSKEDAKEYSARQFYIVRVIDREKENEGVKFWRFPHNYKKTGIYDKIMAAIGAVEHDVSDPETGRDLNIVITRDDKNNPVVQAINYPLKESKLSNDEEKLNLWLADTRTWEDVYATKDYDYLAIIVKGGTPVWNQEKGKFVDKNDTVTSKNDDKEVEDLDNELTMGLEKVKGEKKSNNEPLTTSVTEEEYTISSNDDDDDDDDDLPF